MKTFPSSGPRELSKALRLLALLTFALAAMALSACGSDDGSDSAGGSTAAESAPETPVVADVPEAPASPPTRPEKAGYVYAGSEEQTSAAKAAGEEAAGETVEPPKDKTLGVIQLSGQSATSRSITDATKEIAEMFGFDVEVCDPNFDPQKVPQCATSIASQRPDAVFSVSQNPGPMGSGLKEVADAGGLWFGTGSAADKSQYINDLGVDGFALAQVLDKFMFEQIAERNPNGGKKIFAITAPTVGVASRNSEEQLEKDVSNNEGFDLINHNLDLANAVQDTLNTSRQTLDQNPDLAAMWTLCDFCVPLMAQTVGRKQKGDRKTVVVGQYSNPESIADVRKGNVDGIADYAWPLPVWVGMDQALRKWARDEQPEKGQAAIDSYGQEFLKPYVITKDNALDSGAAPIYGPDFETFFKAKWAKEYGIPAS